MIVAMLQLNTAVYLSAAALLAVTSSTAAHRESTSHYHTYKSSQKLTIYTS